jgi:hypothetical protein
MNRVHSHACSDGVYITGCTCGYPPEEISSSELYARWQIQWKNEDRLAAVIVVSLVSAYVVFLMLVVIL